MKKQAVFYLAWDVLFLLFLRFYSFMSQWLKLYTERAMNIYFSAFFLPVLPVLAGCFIAGLVYINIRHQTTRNSALLELIMIGIPTLYVAASPLIYFIIPGIFNGMYIPIPIWMMRDSIIYSIGGIAFGYEIFIFITRMISFSQAKKSMDSDRPLNDE